MQYDTRLRLAQQIPLGEQTVPCVIRWADNTRVFLATRMCIMVECPVSVVLYGDNLH